MQLVNTEDLVSAYLKIRGKRERLKADYEKADDELKDELAKIETALLGVCNDINADSIKTAHGTAMRKLNERFFCQDWDDFYKYVLENQAPYLLERRVHQSNIKAHLEETKSDGLPPGVSVMRSYGITVRKSNKE
jgi:hypothetical protein